MSRTSPAGVALTVRLGPVTCVLCGVRPASRRRLHDRYCEQCRPRGARRRRRRRNTIVYEGFASRPATEGLLRHVADQRAGLAA